ncbi:MAG: sodium-dependent bicarbonate transport family permease, partial [Chloroflexaceae bacterium]|nr:sodium-dependent bicarbonate transport family permease [Chloroflexaceae bacterium]
MDPLELVRINLFSPMVTAFVLGIIATLVKSDLKIPEALYSSLSIYLLLAIGLERRAGLATSNFADLIGPMLATLVLGVGIPLWSYAILRGMGKFDIANAAAIAAHYGSVSAVTFTASLTFLDTVGVSYEGYMPTLLTVLEVPGIAVALLIAQMRLGNSSSLGAVIHEV